MSDMFSGCSSLISLPDISKWNTKSLQYIDFMFNDCPSLVSLPNISKWKNIDDISKSKDIFYGCLSLINTDEKLNYKFIWHKEEEAYKKKKEKDEEKKEEEGNELDEESI